MLQDGKYPNWEQIMPINWQLENREVMYYGSALGYQKRMYKYRKVGTFDIADYKQVGLGGRNHKEPYAIPYKELGAGLIIPLTKKLDSVFSSLKEKNIPVYGAHPEQGIYFMGKNCMATQMPILYSN